MTEHFWRAKGIGWMVAGFVVLDLMLIVVAVLYTERHRESPPVVDVNPAARLVDLINDARRCPPHF